MRFNSMIPENRNSKSMKIFYFLSFGVALACGFMINIVSAIIKALFALLKTSIKEYWWAVIIIIILIIIAVARSKRKRKDKV